MKNNVTTAHTQQQPTTKNTTMHPMANSIIRNGSQTTIQFSGQINPSSSQPQQQSTMLHADPPLKFHHMLLVQFLRPMVQ